MFSHAALTTNREHMPAYKSRGPCPANVLKPTWNLLAADIKRLEAFHMKCQRQIAKIRWQDHLLSHIASVLC